MSPRPPTSTLFPYTTLFRSPTHRHLVSRHRSRACQEFPPRRNRRHHAGLDFGMSTRRSEEHTSELQSRGHLVCRLLLEKKKEKQAIEHRVNTHDDCTEHTES